MSDYLCEELIAEIFERLPVKSLIRFRCLSKSWCSRFSSPEFISKHSLRSAKAPQNFIMVHSVYHKFKSNQIFSTLHSQDQLPMYGYMSIPVFDFDGYSIAGSCNGILCLLDYKEDIISLWNPSIRRIYCLPPHFSLHAPPLSVFGFGFDPITNDYKIVRLSCSHKAIVDSVVYTVKTGTWCRIDLPTNPLTYTLSEHGCFLNGALYWLVFANSGHRCIMTFDLSTHVIGTIALPSRDGIKVGIIKDYLAVITENQCVWVRKVDNNNVASWHMTAGFNVRSYEGGLHSIFQLKNGDLLYKTCRGNFKVYNIPSGRDLYTFAQLTYGSRISEFGTYVDSLALLDVGFPC